MPFAIIFQRLRLWPIALLAASCTGIASTSPHVYAAAAPTKCVNGKRDSKSYSSVDDREIRWTEASKYDRARTWAQSRWYTSNYRLNKVKVAPDDALTSNDLHWKDKKKADGALATWERHGNMGATDYIYLNKQYLDGRGDWASDYWRKAAAAHEFGHALGFCHKGQDMKSLMTPNMSEVASNQPTDHDRNAYHRLWG
ncbi:matrixin family metalloprotease [Streptomyces sp. BE308]|uniref:matrixin family metalloprotease n=1 Tax=Streptomyces sp. BE308 TaxID=3002529 RepID=UPI002E7634D0|nr:matrixin family metalloprotease [Streptomyces sp. BE308]MEE1792302.1 matrixin family metalloprotease [Streptomyces sp. BE308]